METLFIRQKALSLLGAFEITNKQNQVVYRAKGISGFTRKMILSDASGQEVGLVKQIVTLLRPKFELYEDDQLIGTITGSASPFNSSLSVSGLDWYAEGNFLGWNYTVYDKARQKIAEIHKGGFHLTDFYTLEYARRKDATRLILMILAIDWIVTRN